MYFLWFILIFLIGTFIGHALHWAMHKKWSGKLYKIHRAHHKLYTYNNYYSIRYRSAGKDNSALYFVPLIALIVGSLILLAPSEFRLWLLLESIAIGSINEILHINFHLDDSWLKKFKWFRKLNDLHKQHHRKVNTNYGIFWFGWDRVFGSYSKLK